MICVVAYDIAVDRRRSKLSRMLESMGPRVQKSVFEVLVPDGAARQRLIDVITDIIDLENDQVRIYDIGTTALRTTSIGREATDGWVGHVQV